MAKTKTTSFSLPAEKGKKLEQEKQKEKDVLSTNFGRNTNDYVTQRLMAANTTAAMRAASRSKNSTASASVSKQSVSSASTSVSTSNPNLLSLARDGNGNMITNTSTENVEGGMNSRMTSRPFVTESETFRFPYSQNMDMSQAAESQTSSV